MKSGDRYAIPSNVAKSAGKTVRPELKLVEAEKILRTFVAKGKIHVRGACSMLLWLTRKLNF